MTIPEDYVARFEALRERQARMRRTTVCAHCGEERDDHCHFEPIMVPKSCVCDPTEWGDSESVPDVCSTYILGKDGRCDSCEHDKECHEVKPCADS